MKKTVIITNITLTKIVDGDAGIPVEEYTKQVEERMKEAYKDTDTVVHVEYAKTFVQDERKRRTKKGEENG